MIGFSSIVGSLRICEDDDDFGYRLKLDEKGKAYVAPINSGQLVKIALDGERTITFKRDDKIKFIITKQGPLKVDVKKILYEAVKNDFSK